MGLYKNKKKADSKSLDLTKTQVLNFSEVEQVAKYEKKTSKKPAIVVASIGIFAIMLGAFYPAIYNSLKGNGDDAVRVHENSKFRETTQTVATSNSLECSLTQVNEQDSTTSVTTFTFKVDNGKLNSYEKVLNIVSTAPTLTETPASIIGADVIINSALPKQVVGYTVTKDFQNDPTNPNIVNNYTIKVAVDLTRLDKTTLATECVNNPFLNVEYNLGDNIETIKQNLVSLGYSCN